MMGYISFKSKLSMSSSSDQKKTDDDHSGFMESLDGIRKLDSDRVNLYQDLPRKKTMPIPSLQQNHEKNLNSAHIINQNPEDSWFQQGLQKKIRQRIQSGKLTVEANLDLHGYRREEAETQLREFIHQALHAGLRMVVIIHGKGYRSQGGSVLRPMVLSWLSQQPGILAYCPAQPKDGGKGASYVYLKSG